MTRHVDCVMLIVAAAGVAGCGASARLPVSAGTGPNPVLPPPSKSLIPLVNVVTAKGWSAGGKPVSAEGTTVAAFARGLDHPRWIYVLPHGDVLVAETNAPPRPEDNKGIKGWFFKLFQKKAGVAIDKHGALLVADDVGNTIWRVTRSAASP